MEFFQFTEYADTCFMLFGDDIYKRYMWAYFLIGACCFAVVFLLKAFALFTIARREGYKNSWMAFVPFLNTYYIGVVSDKNRIFGRKPEYFALATAVVEFIYAVLMIIYYVAQGLIFSGGYAQAVNEQMLVGGQEIPLFTGYNIYNLPESLNWAGWVFTYFANAFFSWLDLLWLVGYVFITISFFQTYSNRYYVFFAIMSVLFPISGVFMFAVRNNRGKNYVQYIKERQYRQYQQYQEYMRQNGGFNNQGGSGSGDPYNNYENRGGTPPQDPFDGMGGGSGDGSSNGNSSSGNSSGSGSNDDPFSDL